MPNTLTPPRWFNHGTQLCSGTVFAANVIADFYNEEDAKHAALARNALDVMMRRGWGVQKWRNPAGWAVDSHDVSDKYPVREAYIRSGAFNNHADPFTALVEADKWLSEQEKSHA